MTDAEKIIRLENDVAYLRGLCEALLRVQWNARGEMKGEIGKIEKELDPYFQDWLKRKSEIPIKP